MTHLLLVEDDELLAEQTRQALSRHGVHVTVTHDAGTTLVQLQQLARLDAAVLDQNLGPDNGLDLISPILERFPQCRVLLLTGYGSIAAAVAATHRGAHNYLTKPATPADILDALGAPAIEQPFHAAEILDPHGHRRKFKHLRFIKSGVHGLSSHFIM